jgi:hypothetical protein
MNTRGWLKKRWWLAVLVMVPSLCWAQQEKVTGKVELDAEKVFGPGIEPSVHVALDRTMLLVLASASESNSPQVAEFFDQIHSITVNVFEDMPVETFAKRKAAIGDLVKGLKEKGWKTMVRVPEEEELVEVLSLTPGETIRGITVIVGEEEEVVFVNVEGEIDPVLLGKTLGPVLAGAATGNFDVEALGPILLGARAISYAEEEEYEESVEEPEAVPEPPGEGNE